MTRLAIAAAMALALAGCDGLSEEQLKAAAHKAACAAGPELVKGQKHEGTLTTVIGIECAP